MSVDNVVTRAVGDELKVVHVHVETPSPPELGPLPEELGLHPLLVKRVRELGIERLYRFQAEAIKYISKGLSTVIVSGTGTGKTEAFMLPILDRVLRGPSRKVRAIIMYPTKALARDQFAKLRRLTLGVLGVSAMVYDGDTPERERRLIYAMPPQVLVTNPDMVHVALQEVPAFRKLVSTIEYVVLDELHSYSGVFGAHVAYIVRRLRRIAGKKLVMIGASATIGNPEEHGERLFGEKPVVVASSMGRRNPLVHVMLRALGVSRIGAAARITARLTSMGLKVIVFADSHRVVELIQRALAERGVKSAVHRAGLPARYRRAVEESFKKGDLRAVVATPTLELGIDIGDVEAVVLVGVPPTYSRYLQRTGRCGRRSKGYVFMILGEDPISAYYERHPGEFYNMRPDDVPLNLRNREVASLHLLAMARDLWVRVDELDEFLAGIAKDLIRRGLMVRRGRYLLASRKGIKYLRARRGIRGVGPIVKIVDERGGLVGTREMPMAMRELHPHAIYLAAGKVYESLELDLKALRAIVRPLPFTPPYYTIALQSGGVVSFSEEDRRVVHGVEVRFGEVVVEEVVYGFLARDYRSGTLIGEEALDEPLKYVFETQCVMVTYPCPEGWGFEERAEAFHALEHALITASQTVVGASQTDLGGLSYPSGHIVIYDSAPGGSGLSMLIYKFFENVESRAFRILSECSCEDGCPRCVFTPYCGNNNRMLSRTKALDVLALALRGVRALASGELPEGEPLALSPPRPL